MTISDVRAFRTSLGLEPDGGLMVSQIEAAKVLGKSVRTVRRMTKAGTIPHEREHAKAWPTYSLPALIKCLEEWGRRAA